MLRIFGKSYRKNLLRQLLKLIKINQNKNINHLGWLISVFLFLLAFHICIYNVRKAKESNFFVFISVCTQPNESTTTSSSNTPATNHTTTSSSSSQQASQKSANNRLLHSRDNIISTQHQQQANKQQQQLVPSASIQEFLINSPVDRQNKESEVSGSKQQSQRWIIFKQLSDHDR